MAKYLITGGCGFIGRALARELMSAGAEVRLLDALVPQVHGDTPTLVADADLIVADMRDGEAVSRATAGVDGVFHLAAEVGVGQSMYEIGRYVGANDLGTAVLLQTLIDAPVRRLVVASSMSVYGEGLYRNAWGARVDNARRVRVGERAVAWEPTDADGGPLTPIPTDEDKPVSLASIYALTKYAQERAALIFGEAFAVEVVALRLFNVFGPGQALSNPYTGVLANFGARLAHGQRPIVFEDGRQMRDFVHVRDVARALRLAMETDAAAGQVLNIGSGAAYPIAGVARMLAQAMRQPQVTPDILGKARAGDVRHCFADIARARDVLGFEPEHRLEHALDELVDWIARQTSVDRGGEMRRHLEARGLVS